MTWLVGMDEAGYGPNLGPLVLATTVWRLDPSASDSQWPVEESSPDPKDLYGRLAHRVAREPYRAGRLAIADSKKLYKPGKPLHLLEQGVLAAFRSMGKRPRTWRELVLLLAADPTGAIDSIPWYRGMDFPIPIESPADEQQITDGQQDVSIAAMRARTVFAEEFNARIEQHGNKATMLTAMSLELFKELLPILASGILREPILVLCDKHGGRNRYAPALKQQFPGAPVTICDESRNQSRYLVGLEGTTIDIRFRKSGESFLPTALASMTAKYVRELAMRPFNTFWQQEVPGLNPTAGYPVDAKRFKQEIAPRQKEMNLDDRVLWRVR